MSSPAPDLPAEPGQQTGNSDLKQEQSAAGPAAVPSFGGYIGLPEGIVGVAFWPRAGARIIDLLVHYAIAIGAAFVFGVMLVIASQGHVAPTLIAKLKQTDIWGIILGLVGYAAYHAICEGVHGSSVGKRLLSMVVIQEESAPCRFSAATIRSFAYYVDSLFFGLIGYFAMQKTPQEQRLGDAWAHTIVCKRSQVTPENLRDDGVFLMALLLAVIADTALVLISLLLRIMS